ncbi:hypothetical protein HSX37_16070|uniref:Uncharacterized protein n=1 Tax=Dendrosporobacter quercicolus TaxID=146817 RepID=A0A1G9ZP72_9FIRM|nr:hypothetical protein [Dendrosporobacter quercicolus]NSL49552.1 hypothetical protein [Dendrosporobacter quercicolus DSM 1736]SDN22406.1 hypothetical protein SAMN04488502_1157 [Dendrosporobacter quercicolus]
MIVLQKVDRSGIYALPAGIMAKDLTAVLLNGEPTGYISVKGGTEIDVPLARTESTVTAILREG